MNAIHIPVLTGEILNNLQIKKDGVYMDGTLGDGGHAEQILSQLGPGGLLVAFDQDKDSIDFAKKRLQLFTSQTKFFHSNFKNAKSLLQKENIGPLDGILLDLGVSSRQLENAERGFSFSSDAFPDMRMDRREGKTAYDLVNHSPENDLAEIFKDFGEERYAKRIAKSIARARKEKPIETTRQLSQLIVSVIPGKGRKYKIHPATRVFQALRIAVNKELEALERILIDGVECLKPEGRFCVISFHSLEDRMVKRKFREFEKGCTCPPKIPQCVCGKKSVLKVITRKPVVATTDEILKNPRARSAKLRVAKKLALN